MKIYIRGVIYDSSKEDVGILLSDSDRQNIQNMLPNCSCYLAGPNLTEEKADRMAKKLKQEKRRNND